jgi:hypothetical protein
MVIAFVASAIAPAAELVVNGGFETGDFSGWTLTGNTAFTGVDPNFAYSGNFGAKLGPIGSDGYLSQTLPTVPGGTYVLSYAFENLGGVPNDFGVFWGGVLVPGSDFLNAPSFPGRTFSATLTAPAPNTEVRFYFRQDETHWGLDEVSVKGAPGGAVPEPSTLGLAAAGTLVVGLLRTRLLRARNGNKSPSRLHLNAQR